MSRAIDRIMGLFIRKRDYRTEDSAIAAMWRAWRCAQYFLEEAEDSNEALLEDTISRLEYQTENLISALKKRGSNQ
jgi:predicted type IV restriction endonuclease